MNLIEYLKKNEVVRSIFGKRELIIIQKQLLGLNLTQSEKNRLSRNIRKKFRAIKELYVFNQDFELKYANEIKKMIAETKDILLNSKYKNNIRKIVLFGSSANKTRTLSSDIDISVEFKDIDKNAATLFKIDIMKKLNSLVDIQVYNVLSEKIKKEINSNGKEIFNEK